VSAPRVAAHLILGPRDEPFLGALLASLEGSVQSVIVNDNAPDPSPHARTLAESAFAANRTLVVDRTPFVDFSSARNICLRLHRERDAGAWVAFVDADEVHGVAVARIAANLDRVPGGVAFVDGYTWHFFQSPDWYTSIERRMAFFRFGPEVRWEGSVHEHLHGIDGGRIALPYVYGHYGHVLSPRRHAEKGRLYSSLGQAGEIVAADALDTIDPATYFADKWPILLPFHGEHPPAVLPTLARLRVELADQFARADALVRAKQPWWRRARNALESANYDVRWRGRGLDPLARSLMGA
jgi:hypothetical protein